MAGGGETGALMRGMDWSSTPLGPVASWPQSLRTALSLVLNSRFELFIWWGPNFIMLYNEAYRQTLAAKHPMAMGKPGSEVWSEIWDVIGPMLEKVRKTGEATWSDDLLLILERHGYPEETYHTFSYSAIRDESGGVGGVFTAVSQTSERVIGERRLRTLRDLASELSDARSELEAWRVAAECLESNPYDVSFVTLYRLEEDAYQANSVGNAGMVPDHPFCPKTVYLDSPKTPIAALLTEVISTGKPREVADADSLGFDLPGGVWQVRPKEIILLPLAQTGQLRPLGILVAGVNPRKRLDESYRTFFKLVASHVAKGVVDAQAYEQERKRAEALAELDRAKTAFFSNVSHEFRTPLTLMLGPAEDALTDAENPLAVKQRDRLETLHRNSIRLLKLVNTLLDFSRIEAGRIEAVFKPTELDIYTAELASVFRSATDRAGIRLLIHCDPLPKTAYVDREMWEKIVLNLLSNAFKFTFEGEIEVCLREVDGKAELSVRDTGTGIPDEEIPHIFKRFHRVQSARGRTHEGTGIGLALVDELVRLHGGSVDVRSKLAEGSTFVVRIPLGSHHLPPDKVLSGRDLTSTAMGTMPYVQEALRWLPGSGTEDEGILREAGNEDLTSLFPQQGNSQISGRIILADDNRDMREYLQRLLAQRYQVTAVENGEQALAEARIHPPDLLLTDVMMPNMDGFGLLKALRLDPNTASIPIVMLSARAGEEARVEGMEAGADDYLVKPFTARELLARVGSHISMHRFRNQLSDKERELRVKAEEAEDRYRRILESISEGFLFLDRQWIIRHVNSHGARISRKSPEELAGSNFWQSFPDATETKFAAALEKAFDRNVVVNVEDFYKPYQIWLTANIYPSPDGLSIFFRDTTENRKQAEALLISEKLAATGRLAATIAHEINNPLEAVVNLLYLARNTPGTDLRVKSYLATAEQEMNRVSHIARQTLGFYRDTSVRTIVNITDLLNDVLSVYQSRMRARSIQVVRQFEPVHPTKAMKGELHQVFSNLISNSIDAMERGGILTIRVKPADSDGKRGVCIQVQDTGTGIPTEHHAKLFEPFFTTKASVGTGLGLWVVKQFIQNHLGDIRVKSEKGSKAPGTTFEILLPVLDN